MLLSKEETMLGAALMCDPVEVDYTYTEKLTDSKSEQTLKLSNLGLLICIWQRSKECWERLLGIGGYLARPKEVLQVALMLAAEDWKEGVGALVPYIENAFSKVSLMRRLEFMHKMLKIGTQTMKEVVRIEKLLTFAEWMYENHKS